MDTENLLNKDVTVTMHEHLRREEYDQFFHLLEPLENVPLLEEPALAIREEWRKLQIARKNGLMDDEQINLALIAFFKKKLRLMNERLEEEPGD